MDENAAAYELYLRAYYEIWRFKEDALDRIVQDLQNALDITGPNALLYSALADAFRQYVNIGFINYPYISKHDTFFDNVRGEERFKKLMERVKYEWEHFEE